MSEIKKDEFEITMSGKIQKKSQITESASTGFRKIEKLGEKTRVTGVSASGQFSDAVKPQTTQENLSDPVQEKSIPVLNIAKQIQTNPQNEVTEIHEDNPSDNKKADTDAPKREKRTKSNGSKKKTGRVIAGVVAAVIVIFAIILLWPCDHEWVDATCTTAKTCSKCEDTEGEPLGHSWSKATCTKPSECKLCKETEGKAMGHKWKETEEYDFVNSKIIKYSVCNTCKTKENKTTTPLNSILGKDKTKFYLSPQDFAKRLDRILNKAEETQGYHAVWVDNVTLDDPGVEIKNRSGELEAVILFQHYKNSTLEGITANDKQRENYTSQIMLITMTYYKDMFNMLMGFVQACDPELEDAPTTAATLVAASTNDFQVYGDIVYRTKPAERGYIVLVMPLEEARS